jgi:hypothetical protein
MENMYTFYKNNNFVECLPMTKEHNHFEDFNMIFDAAAIGQYLGGVDRIHQGGGIPGFINPHFNIDFSKYIFRWVKENDVYIPKIKVKEQFYKIAGLHIHSKDLCNFQADCPKEQRLIRSNSLRFISFGAGNKDFRGPQDYTGAVKRISQQASLLHIFDSVKGYTEDDLIETEYWEQHKDFIHKTNRGFGYMIWKSYFILKNLETMNENDMLLYADCGCEIDITKKNKIIEMINKKNDILCSTAGIEKRWTKRDLFIYLDVDHPHVTDTLQFENTSILFRKCEKTLQLVKEWYQTGCKYNLSDDSPSKSVNYPEFEEHRHDQSIFSLLMKKYNYTTQFLIGSVIELSRNRTGISNIKLPFDWKTYVQNYPDLQAAGINTEKKALHHYNRFGKKEGRTFICNT